MSNYYSKRDAKVRLAEELSQRGWKIYGYKENESDMMTDYYSPADWDGIATKNGFTLVIDNRYNGNSGKAIEVYNRNYVEMSESDRTKIESLKNMTQEKGATEGEETNAKSLIEKIQGKYDNQTAARWETVGYYPEFMVNAKGTIWHIEKDGALVDRGNQLTIFADVPYSYEFDINTMQYKDSYKYVYNYGEERKERTLTETEEKAIKALKNFILRVERAANGMNTCGDGTAETERKAQEQQENEKMEKVVETITKKVLKMVEVTNRKEIKVGDYITLAHHGHYWKVTREYMQKGTWKGIQESKKAFVYEIVGSASRGYQDLKNPKSYYDYEFRMLKDIEAGKTKIYELKEVEETQVIEKWVKVKIAKKETVKAEKTNTAVKESQEEVKNENTQEVKETVTAITNEIGEFILTEDLDTRDNSQLWVLKLTEKVSKEDFDRIRNYIKSIKGYYSRFKGGFIFKFNPCEVLGVNTDTATNNNNIDNDAEIIEVEEIAQDKETTIKNSYENDKIEEGYIYTCHFKEWNMSIEEIQKYFTSCGIEYIDMYNKIGFEKVNYNTMLVIEQLSNKNGSILFIDSKEPITQQQEEEIINNDIITSEEVKETMPIETIAETQTNNDTDKSKTYILNLETNRIELHFTKEEYQALSQDLKKELKTNYLFSKHAQAWVSKSTKNHYWAVEIAKKLGFTEKTITGERLSFEEELQRKKEKAEARIERYEQYAENASDRGRNLQSEFNTMRKDWSFVTQPNISSSGGRAFTKYREKIMNRYSKGFEEYRKSEYFKEKAEAAQATADQSQLKNKTYLYNRIKECQSLVKKYESYIISAEEKGNNEAIENYLHELEYQIDKQAFLENCIDELGGIIYSQENIKVGYMVKIRRDWETVIKVNKTTVEVKSRFGSCIKYPYAEIQEIKIPENLVIEEITNPYKEGDILVNYNVSGNRIISAYQVLKTTAKSVTIQKINIDNNIPIKDGFTLEKPMRKGIVKSKYSDFIGAYDGNWQLHLYNAGQEQEAM